MCSAPATSVVPSDLCLSSCTVTYWVDGVWRVLWERRATSLSAFSSTKLMSFGFKPSLLTVELLHQLWHWTSFGLALLLEEPPVVHPSQLHYLSAPPYLCTMKSRVMHFWRCISVKKYPDSIPEDQSPLRTDDRIQTEKLLFVVLCFIVLNFSTLMLYQNIAIKLYLPVSVHLRLQCRVSLNVTMFSNLSS